MIGLKQLVHEAVSHKEIDTMPQWAGSSWYFLRYMDPHNDEALASKRRWNIGLSIGITAVWNIQHFIPFVFTFLA